jgi:hypothetical protein
MFPSVISDDVPGIFHPRDKAGFRHLKTHYPVQAYSSFLIEGRIFFKRLKWNNELDFHFSLLGSESFNYHISQTIPWSKVEKRLGNDAYVYKYNFYYIIFFQLYELIMPTSLAVDELITPT